LLFAAPTAGDLAPAFAVAGFFGFGFTSGISGPTADRATRLIAPWDRPSAPRASATASSPSFSVWYFTNLAADEQTSVPIERIGALALAGDAAGVDRWKAIAKCMVALGAPPTGRLSVC
jgi:hypothetical protein